MAEQGKAETINFDKKDVYDSLMEMTKGRGPDTLHRRRRRRGPRRWEHRCRTR